VFPGLPDGPELEQEPLELSDELLDALLSGARTAQEIAGPDGLLGQLTRRLLNRALEAELSEERTHTGTVRRRDPRPEDLARRGVDPLRGDLRAMLIQTHHERHATTPPLNATTSTPNPAAPRTAGRIP
jgi:hypothetical protein